MSQINVEKGFPIPEVRKDSMRKYPWKEMEIGDSFFLEGITRNRAGSICNGGMRNNSGKKFSYRSIDGGVRIWRVE
jgi:hypothetical protein